MVHTQCGEIPAIREFDGSVEVLVGLDEIVACGGKEHCFYFSLAAGALYVEGKLTSNEVFPCFDVFWRWRASEWGGGGVVCCVPAFHGV